MKLRWWLVPIASWILAGCLDLSSSDDDDSGSDGPVATETVTGKAADGYLYGATACLDVNENKVCDPTEPKASTGPNGDFSISATPANANKPIVVEVVVGTIDQDDPDNPIDSAFTLTAPAGYSFVSPLTTLVQNEIDSNNLSADDAEAAVKQLLGTSLDLNKDYVAGSKATGDDIDASFAEEFKKIHKVAQVATKIIKKNAKTVDDAGSSVDKGDALRVIVTKVASAVEEIVKQVASAGDDFDADTIAAVESIDTATKVDPTTIEEEIEVADDIKGATDANMGTVLASGVYWLEEELFFDEQAQKDRVFFGYGFTKYDGTNQTISFHFFNGTEFVMEGDDNNDDNNDDSNDDSSNDDENQENDDFLVLTASGFVPMEDGDSDGPDFSAVNTDGSVRMDIGPFGINLYGQEVDISNKKIRTTLLNTRNWLWADAVGDTATFAAGSKAYRLRQEVAESFYGLPYEQPSENSGCDEDEAVGTTKKSCSYAHVLDVANEVFGEAVAGTTSLLVSTPAESAATLKGVVVYHEDISDSESKVVILEMQSNKTARFIQVKFTDDGPSGFNVLATTTFSEQTVHGQSIMLVAIPDNVPKDFGDSDDGGPQFSKVYLVAYEGFWRLGVVIEKGEVLPDDAPFVMNETAKNSAEAAFNIDNIDLNEGNVDVIKDPDQVPDDDGGSDDNIGSIYVPCRFGDSGWDEENDEPAVLLGFDDFVDSVTDCRLQGNTLTGGGFATADVSGKTLKFGEHEEFVFNADGTGSFNAYNEDGSLDEDESEALTWTIGNTGGATSGDYLVLTADAGDIVAVFALVAKQSNEYLIKGYIKDTDEDADGDDDDGFSDDLTINNDDDGEVISMVWVEEAQ